MTMLMCSMFMVAETHEVGEDCSNKNVNNKTELVQKNENTWDKLIQAIIYVESKGNDNAKHGSSVGALQITPIAVAQCNKILQARRSKKHYTLSDRFSRKKSIEMFNLIQEYFNPKKSIEKAIRLWNGGNNYIVKRTQNYYNKVISKFRKIKN